MGQLSCNRCGAKAEADTQENADVLIDHARGQMIGRPCSGKQSDLVWDGSKTAKHVVVNVVEPKAETVSDSDSPTKKPKHKRR